MDEDLDDPQLKKVTDEVQSLIDQAKKDREDQPPKKVSSKPVLKRVMKLSTTERTRQTARKRVEEEEDEEEEQENQEEEEEEVVQKSKKPKRVVVDLDQEEEDEKQVSQNALMLKMMSEIQRLGDQLKSRSQDQDSLVLPSTFNWKTTERNVKQIHGIRRTLSGSFLVFFDCLLWHNKKSFRNVV
jgi:hypothetical protein